MAQGRTNGNRQFKVSKRIQKRSKFLLSKVRLNEQPYKIVKARPKWDRMTGTVTKGLPLEVYGHWQTEIYQPPPAVDGKVPRNEYGNVELFKEWMLPKGTVHIPIQGKGFLSKITVKFN